jgi:hypothetical protein
METKHNWAGLCVGCLHTSVTRTAKGGIFYLCRRSLNDPNYPKYPPIPVRACAGFEPISPSSEPPDLL